MSARRLGPGRYLDPYTGEEFRAELLGCQTSGPVEVVRPGTAPAADAAPAPRRSGYVLVNRQAKGTYIAHVSDAEVLAALATTSTQAEAAERLHVSQSSLCRRLAQIRESFR